MIFSGQLGEIFVTFQERLPNRRAQRSLGQYMMDLNILSASQMLRAKSQLYGSNADLGTWLVADKILTPTRYAMACADWLGARYVPEEKLKPDIALLSPYLARSYLRHMILPLYREQGFTYVATARPERFERDLHALGQDLGPVMPIVTTPEALQNCVARLFCNELTQAASQRVPSDESCRRWGRNSRWRIHATIGFVGAVLGLALWQPLWMFTALTAWASFTLLIAALMRLISLGSFVSSPAPQPASAPANQTGPPRDRPVISVLVPLFREKEIAQALLKRLERLEYPKHLLDVILVLEENDQLTHEAVAMTDLPHWMRVVVVPEGHPKTKPRAMNYALDFCRGDIIGIFDAEDAPSSDQLGKVAARFAEGPADLVCLQGVLDYYNARQNWLARCFTIEYATWFRVMLPGMARLGFAIPLGGTTLYFKRAALEQLGGWDAHNVTEDADLGFRLARHGFRTEMLHTTTREEANCHAIPWVKQRSRWLKGYMVTYLVHMRRPGTLLRQLGPLKFLGFQMHFVTALSQFLLAPLLWSLWLIALGLPHPLPLVVSDEWIRTLAALFIGAEICTMMAGFVAVSGPAHRHLLPWVPTMHFYFPLGVLAAYKALYELIFAPFYWDKTQHGHSLKSPGPTAEVQADASSLSRVTKALEM
jgi:cellulose synthase/poly-beta-1,6-N-acetylglucosamine synthase-like glycosyltransferase